MQIKDTELSVWDCSYAISIFFRSWYTYCKKDTSLNDVKTDGRLAKQCLACLLLIIFCRAPCLIICSMCVCERIFLNKQYSQRCKDWIWQQLIKVSLDITKNWSAKFYICLNIYYSFTCFVTLQNNKYLH